MEKNKSNKTDTYSSKLVLEDVEKMMGPLLQENLLFSNEYFSIISENLSSFNTEKSLTKFIILSSINELKETLKSNTNAPDLIAVSSILDVVLYPLQLDVKLNKKTYKSFNIDIDFFKDIKNQNSLNYYNTNSTDMIIVKSFNFNKRNKLSSFVLYKSGYNMSYKYNSKYVCTTIIFPDGSEMKIGGAKINAKKRKKNKSN